MPIYIDFMEDLEKVHFPSKYYQFLFSEAIEFLLSSNAL